MNRRLFLKALGIGAASAPVVATLFNESDAANATTATEPPKLANGGFIPAGKPYFAIGEHGPEMVVTVNSQVSPEQIVKALREYERRNGRDWR